MEHQGAGSAPCEPMKEFSMLGKLNERINQEWDDLGKRLAETSAATRAEAAGAAAEVLKTLAKELGALGERLDRLAGMREAPSKKPDAPSGAE